MDNIKIDNSNKKNINNINNFELFKINWAIYLEALIQIGKNKLKKI